MALSEDRRTEIFADLYTTALRAATKNPWLRPPKVGSEKWNQLEAARKMVEEMGGEYGDFIRVQFAAMQKFRTVPAPHHLCSKNAIQRYSIHQKMKNKYHHTAYSVEGDEFIVNCSGKRYPLKQVDAPVQDDPVANYAHVLAREGLLPENKIEGIIALEYAIAKLRYKDKVPTDSMIRMLKKCKENP